MIRRPPRSTPIKSSAASDVYKRQGYTNAEIASRMFISERTAKAHLSSAANKLDMGRVQMARLVERADLPARL